MIVITTPTGAIGRQVLENVLKSNEAVRIIARNPAGLPAQILNRVEVITGSHNDAAVVKRAFTDADSVFWLVPPAYRADSVEAAFMDFSRAACHAFIEQGVKRVVGISALGRGVNEHAGLVTASLMVDDMITSTGINYRALTMPSFMDNMLRQVEAIKNLGMIFSPIDGDLKVPTCATRDIASVAASYLLEHNWNGQASVPVLGPEDLSFNDMAHIISEVVGKTVRFQQISIEVFKEQLAKRGMSAAMMQGVVDMYIAKSEGLDNAEIRTVENSTPTSFKTWCEEILKPAVLG